MTPRIFVTQSDLHQLEQMLSKQAARVEDRPYVASLQSELRRAEVVDAESLPPNVVTMNSRVQVYDVSGKEREVITLVYPWESDPENNRISVLAPVGTALLGCSVGDTINWPTPSGIRRLRVETLVFQPERQAATVPEET
jgi:regulator of nucleoside diphosphate kinase